MNATHCIKNWYSEGEVHNTNVPYISHANSCVDVYIHSSSTCAGQPIQALAAIVKTQDKAIVVAGLADGLSQVLHVTLSNRHVLHIQNASELCQALHPIPYSSWRNLSLHSLCQQPFMQVFHFQRLCTASCTQQHVPVPMYSSQYRMGTSLLMQLSLEQ